MNRSAIAIFAAALFAPNASALHGQSAEVQQLYQKAHAEGEAGDVTQAVADYKHILRLAPEIGPAYNNLGRLLFNVGRFSDAADILRQGLAVDPTMHAAEVMLGATYLQLARPVEAIPPLQRGVQAMPDDRYARLTLAQALVKADRPDEAIAQLNALIARDPKDQEAWYTLGKLHLQLSQTALSRAQTIDPNTPLAHQLAGEVMEGMANTQGAIAEYKLALAAAPDDSAALEHLAGIYWSTGDWAHAQERFRTLSDKQPGNCVAHWKLANAMDELAQPPADGLREINIALDQCPELPQAHAERARLLLRTGKPTDALPDLLKAEKAAPDEPSIQRLLAQAYRALGDRKAADQANARFEQLSAAEHAAKERHAADVIQANR